MPRTRTWITLAAVLLLAALVAALLAPRLVGEARLRAEVERRATSALGRDVRVRGPIRVTTGAWIEIDASDVTIAGSPGTPPLARIGRLRAPVSSRSLLSGPIEVGRVRIDVAAIHLSVDAGGRGSWEGLGGASDAPTRDGTPTAAAARAESAAARSSRAWRLDGLELRGSSLRYSDARSGASYECTDWNATVGRVALPEPFDVRTDFRASRAGAPLGRVQIAARVASDPVAQRHAVEHLAVDASLDVPRAPAPAKLAIARIDYDGRADTASVRGLQADALGVRLRADGSAADLATRPRLDATFFTEAFDPRAPLAALGTTLPPMQGPAAFERASVKGRAAMHGGDLAIESLVATLDDTTLNGRATHAGADGWSFDLAADRLTVDRYLKPPKLRDRSPVLLPTELLRSLDVRGTLRVGELVASGIRMKNVTIELDGRPASAAARPR